MPYLLCKIFLITLCLSPMQAADIDPRLQTALTDLDQQFDSCYAWWGKVYDPQSGGCYYSLSGKALRENGNKNFGPDIEATSKLVNVLHWSGILEQTPQAFKDGIIQYMQQRQDPESGFFRDPKFAKDYTAKTLNRAVGMAAGSIEKCGGSPKHPLPLERVADNEEAAQHFAHLKNVETLRTWLTTLPWEKRIWTAGSTIRTQSGTFKELEEPRRSQLLDELERFLTTKQHSDGYYGHPKDDHWWSRLSGTYKAVSMLEANDRPVPMVETLIQTVMQDLRQRTYTNLIVLYNTANILAILNRNGGNFPLEQRIEIIERATAILKQFKHSDGGFLTDTTRARPSANGKLLGKKGVMESNTNSTGLAHKTRGLLIEIVSAQQAPYPHPAGTPNLLRPFSKRRRLKHPSTHTIRPLR